MSVIGTGFTLAFLIASVLTYILYLAAQRANKIASLADQLRKDLQQAAEKPIPLPTTAAHQKLYDLALAASEPATRSGNAAVRRAAIKLRNAVKLSMSIIESVDSDAIGCVKADPNFKRNYSKVVIPGSGAHATPYQESQVLGDAVITQPKIGHARNPLLEVIRNNILDVREAASAIRVKAEPTLMTYSEAAKIDKLLNDLEEMHRDLQAELLIACSEQRQRLKYSVPSLSHYTFATELPHTAEFDMPRYVYGKNPTPTHVNPDILRKVLENDPQPPDTELMRVESILSATQS